MKKIAAVILAAGASKRLGTNKLTLRINGEAVIVKALRPFLSSVVERIILVASKENEDVRECLAGFADNIRIVVNHDSKNGMSTSVRAAIPYVTDTDGVFFHLGDKPFLDPELPARMMMLYGQDSSRIIIPRFEGKTGHPVLMNIKPFIPEIKSLSGDRGLRDIIDNHKENVLFIDGNEGSLFDIDTVEDLNKLRERGYRVEES